MFSNCCCTESTRKATDDIADNREESKNEVTGNELPALEKSVSSTVNNTADMPVIDQPTSTCAPRAEQDKDKRQSVVSEIKIEISDNDDDEVFCEGVGPPIKLASNLGTPHNKNSLPRWFSEDDDQEVGGVQEPPATPIGRDELALRRHRLFSELLSAAQNATEHRVRFDPLGPVVAGGEHHFCIMSCSMKSSRYYYVRCATAFSTICSHTPVVTVCLLFYLQQRFSNF